MSETNQASDLDVRQSKPSIWRRLSFVWLVPILALVVSLGVAWQSFQDLGVEIEITFENASGIVAGETEIRYRDVVVGRVERVEFTRDLQDVLVYARVDQPVHAYMDEDARFWVVRPDVSVRGISGLDTVLSGVYIQGNWNEVSGDPQDRFQGLETPPVVPPGQRGTELVLRTDEGTALSAGAPILHQGIEVGVLSDPVLSDDGQSVTVAAFVREPYDALITSSTRFWDTAGFSVSLGASGVSLNVSSLASLIEGGVAFDTVVSGGEPIEDGQIFDLFTDEESARSSLFNDAGAPKLQVAVLFDGSVSGLTVGSDVRYQGIRIGQVTDLGATVVSGEAPEDTRIDLRTILSIEPARLGLGDEATPENALDLLASFVDQGLRARLATGNILSGGLIVELVEVADALPVVLDTEAEPYPIIPSTASQITDVADEAQGVLARINDLPIEDLLASAIDVMDSANAILRSDGVLDTPEQVAGLLADVRDFVDSEPVQQVPTQIADLLAQLQDTAAGLLGVVQSVEDADIVGQTGTILSNVEGGTQNLSQITTELEATLAKVNELELQALVAQANAALVAVEGVASNDDLAEVPVFLNQLLAEAQALVASEGVQAVPGQVSALLAQVQDTAGGLLGIVQSIEDNNVVGQAGAILTNVEDGTANLPQISDQLEATLAKLNALELEALLTQADQALASVEAVASNDDLAEVPVFVNQLLEEVRLLVESGDVQALPGELRSVTGEAGQILSDLTAQNISGQLTNAIAAAATAAENIETASAQLPAITEQLNQLSAEAARMDLDALSAAATGVLDDISAITGTPSAQALPASLSSALDELQLILADVREGGAIENVNAALQSASDAADAIEVAAATLPAFTSEARGLIGTANTTIGSYGTGSRVDAELQQTLRDLQTAADAITTLARQIQRNPNSLLTGR
ncbi:PqiB family protein [Salipiger sp. IMCC34102]|uniref:PqiB family protein n=1 Tax=Salipiger sp. IMCC34102 TaxID=2510647 RepID=UPI0013EC91A6|nr:MlaD family protein [Salipiger sp. IMCC34102]